MLIVCSGWAAQENTYFYEYNASKRVPLYLATQTRAALLVIRTPFYDERLLTTNNAFTSQTTATGLSRVYIHLGISAFSFTKSRQHMQIFAWNIKKYGKLLLATHKALTRVHLVYTYNKA